MNKTYRDHLARIGRALEFIERHLPPRSFSQDRSGDPLTIESIAGEAAFSPWHFQRLFSAMVGESVMSYVRGRRLTLAMDQLLMTRRPIVEIAWDHRFESQESFTRAFKSQFGVTPGTFRKLGWRNEGCKGIRRRERAQITPEYLDNIYRNSTMEAIIREFPERNVIGIGAPFISILSPNRNNFVVIPQLWDTIINRLDEVTGRSGEWMLGLCGELPEGMERSRGDEFYYLAGVEVSSLDMVPDGMIGQVVPAGKFAIFTHKGSLQKLGETMNYIYGRWLPESGYERAANVPDIELYDSRFNPESEDSELDICIPIA